MQRLCTCAQAMVAKYQKRISDLLLDRIDIQQQVTIQPVITSTMTPSSQFYTNEYDIYDRLGEWGYQHMKVNHSAGKYACDKDGDGFHGVHVNTLEGFWSLLHSLLAILLAP